MWPLHMLMLWLRSSGQELWGAHGICEHWHSIGKTLGCGDACVIHVFCGEHFGQMYFRAGFTAMRSFSWSISLDLALSLVSSLTPVCPLDCFAHACKGLWHLETRCPQGPGLH